MIGAIQSFIEHLSMNIEISLKCLLNLGRQPRSLINKKKQQILAVRCGHKDINALVSWVDSDVEEERLKTPEFRSVLQEKEVKRYTPRALLS